jgi:hypothetical protein
MNINELTKQKWFVPAAVVVALIVIGSLMRNSGEYAAEQALERMAGGDADVDYDDGEVTVRTDEGEWSTGGDVPSGWPSDVPVYRGAKVVSSASSNPSTGEKGYYLALQSSDAPDAVAEFYKRELAANGWTIRGTTTVNGGTYVGAEKGGRDLAIAIAAAEGGSSISIGVSEE